MSHGTTEPQASYQIIGQKFASGVTFFFGDVHANIQGLEAVLSHASGKGFKNAFVLGDLLDYGANPNEAVERVRMLEVEVKYKQGDFGIIPGNHDELALAGEQEFERMARGYSKSVGSIGLITANWTREELGKENREWMMQKMFDEINNKFVQDFECNEFYAAHGGPKDLKDRYANLEGKDGYAPEEGASRVKQRHLFVGHSHMPGIWKVGEGNDEKTVVCVPSAGQPRDGNYRVGYALFEPASSEVELVRVEKYEMLKAAQAIKQSTMPRNAAKVCAGMLSNGRRPPTIQLR